MKKLSYILVFMFVSFSVMGQEVSLGENYVRTTSYQVKTQDGTVKTNTQPPQPLTSDHKIESVTYFDGLGRPMQSISKQSGGNKQDIVKPIVYDALGRQVLDYLPYVRSGSNSLLFSPQDPAFFTDLNDQYLSRFPLDLDPGSPNPYSEKRFENSPLNRILEQAAPGEDWKMDNGHTIKFIQETNGMDEVILFSTDYPNNNLEEPELLHVGFYGPNELYKSITKDENWSILEDKDHTTEEFKDKQGRVILKRSYDLNQPHDTYYVYDDYGNLVYVLSPEGTATILDNVGDILQTALDKLCYQYRYDHRNRLIEKKIPGKGWEYIIYDNLDRPVMTQDANQRNQSPKEWLFTKYDFFGRVAYTGLFIDNGTRQDLQGSVNSQLNNPNPNVLYEERNLTSIAQDLSTVLYYTNNVFPNTPSKIFTINYYDTYTNLDGDGLILSPNTPIYDDVTSASTKSLPTVSKVRILGTDQWTTTVTHYDEKARPIYIATKNNYLGATDIAKYDIDFVGKTLRTQSSHTMGSNPTISVEDFFSYDHTGRLLTQIQKINNGPGELIVNNHYDALGQLISKNVGGTPSTIAVESQGLQTVDYDYTIRGWLKNINNGTTENGDLFGFGLNYNSGSAPLYNGNISETHWQTASDHKPRSYVYAYDALNRITNANYHGSYIVATTAGQLENYTVSGIGYDRNGNIQHLKRNGHLDQNITAMGIMDDLSYHYNGNQLHSVSDLSTAGTGFKDGNISDSSFDTTLDNDYSYDSNGNMIVDSNKRIVEIKYNHLNLPTRISITDSEGPIALVNYINYVYDATGVKQSKGIEIQGVANDLFTQYAGNYIYKGTYYSGFVFEFFNQPEGYVEPDGSGGYQYVYQYKDHLGNVRLSYTNNAKGVQSFTTNFDDGVATPWTKSSSSTNMEVIDGRLRVVTGSHLNGANGYYDLNSGVEYVISLNVDNSSFAPDLEFSIFKGNIKKYGDYYVDVNNQEIFIKFTPDVTGTYRLNLRLREYGYSGGDQTFFVDNVNITPSLTIVEENNYYPFGLEHKGYNNVVNGTEYNYKQFQGQEWTEDLGLNWHEWKYRFSDPAIGRFISIDPLSESFYHNGTYNFAENRVIDGFELEGLEWVDTDDGWQYQGYDYGPSPVPQNAIGVAPEGSSPVASWVSQEPRGIPFTGSVSTLNVGGPDGTVQQFTANDSGMVELPFSGTEQTGAGSSGTYAIDGHTVYGYYNRNDVAGAVEDQWGTPENISNMINAITEFDTQTLLDNPVQIGDMRSPTNGRTNISANSTHHGNNGAFDVRLLGGNGGLPGGTTINNNNFSTQNTQLFINSLGNNGFSRFLIGPNAVPNLNNSGTINVRNGGNVHNNHYHIDVD